MEREMAKKTKSKMEEIEAKERMVDINKLIKINTQPDKIVERNRNNAVGSSQ